MRRAEHGTTSAYNHHGCRCAPCRSAFSRYQRDRRAIRRAGRQLIDERLVAVHAPRHGTAATYSNWGCHCEPCSAAGAVANAANKAARRARAAT